MHYLIIGGAAILALVYTLSQNNESSTTSNGGGTAAIPAGAPSPAGKTAKQWIDELEKFGVTPENAIALATSIFGALAVSGGAAAAGAAAAGGAAAGVAAGGSAAAAAAAASAGTGSAIAGGGSGGLAAGAAAAVPSATASIAAGNAGTVVITVITTADIVGLSILAAIIIAVIIAAIVYEIHKNDKIFSASIFRMYSPPVVDFHRFESTMMQEALTKANIHYWIEEVPDARLDRYDNIEKVVFHGSRSLIRSTALLPDVVQTMQSNLRYWALAYVINNSRMGSKLYVNWLAKAIDPSFFAENRLADYNAIPSVLADANYTYGAEAQGVRTFPLDFGLVGAARGGKGDSKLMLAGSKVGGFTPVLKTLVDTNAYIALMYAINLLKKDDGVFSGSKGEYCTLTLQRFGLMNFDGISTPYNGAEIFVISKKLTGATYDWSVNPFDVRKGLSSAIDYQYYAAGGTVTRTGEGLESTPTRV